MTKHRTSSARASRRSAPSKSAGEGAGESRPPDARNASPATKRHIESRNSGSAATPERALVRVSSTRDAGPNARSRRRRVRGTSTRGVPWSPRRDRPRRNPPTPRPRSIRAPSAPRGGARAHRRVPSTAAVSRAPAASPRRSAVQPRRVKRPVARRPSGVRAVPERRRVRETRVVTVVRTLESDAPSRIVRRILAPVLVPAGDGRRADWRLGRIRGRILVRARVERPRRRPEGRRDKRLGRRRRLVEDGDVVAVATDRSGRTETSRRRRVGFAAAHSRMACAYSRLYAYAAAAAAAATAADAGEGE